MTKDRNKNNQRRKQYKRKLDGTSKAHREECQQDRNGHEKEGYEGKDEKDGEWSKRTDEMRKRKREREQREEEEER